MKYYISIGYVSGSIRQYETKDKNKRDGILKQILYNKEKGRPYTLDGIIVFTDKIEEIVFGEENYKAQSFPSLPEDFKIGPA